MRIFVGVMLVAFLSPMVVGKEQEKAANETRYGIALDNKTYPQDTAKETLASLLKAVEDKRVDYVVAQLADPSFVDERVKRLYSGRFVEQVDDTRARLDPLTIKQLQRFLKDGVWQEDKDRVTVRLKEDNRCLYFKKGKGRWFMEHGGSPTP